jgi:peptidyl-prolyl cis-trans isomerase D
MIIMRKKNAFTLLTALLLCASLLLTGCGDMVELDQEKDLDTVLATAYGKDITKRDVMNYYIRNKATMDVTTEIENNPTYESMIRNIHEMLLSQLVDNEVVKHICEEQGLYPFSEEQQAEVNRRVDEMYEKRIDGYLEALKSYGFGQGTDGSDAKTDEEIRETAKTDVDEIMANSYADSRAMDTYIVEAEYLKELLRDSLTADVDVTEEEIKEYYDEQLEMQKKDFDEDTTWIIKFLTFESFKDSVIVYYPGGVVRVKQILIGFDDATSSEISQLRNNGETEQADAKRKEALAGIRSKAEDVLALAQSGDDFDELIVEYNTDPGMATEQQRAEGYLVAKDSTDYVEAFRDAAVALEKAGDVSALVETDFGYHIIQAMEVFDQKEVPYDEVHDALKTRLEKLDKDEVFNAKVNERREADKPKVHEKRVQQGGYKSQDYEAEMLFPKS